MHPTIRRIRRHEQRSGFFAPRDRRDLRPFLFSIALPFSKSRRLLTPGLKSKPMYNKGKLDPRPLAASQSYIPFFLAATAYPHALCTGLQSPAAIFLREKPAFETPEVRRELLTRSGRSSTNFTLPLGNVRVTEALYQRPQAHRAPHEPCFSRFARQPQQPVVQALRKI